MLSAGPLLVGFDGSASGREALALASALARALDRRVEVVSVLTEIRAATVAEYDAMVHEAEKRLATEAHAVVADADVETWLVPSDSPTRELHDFAVAHDAVAVVLGSTHHGTLGRIVPGSMVNRLLSASPCPIAVAPAGYRRTAEAFAEIAVAFDGSPEAQVALDMAQVLARRDRSRLKLIGVVNPRHTTPVAVTVGPLTGMIPTGEGIERERERLRVAIDEATAEITGLSAIGEVRVDFDPAAGIREAAASSDLLVCGSRGYGPLGRVLLGSVSHGLLNGASCPVMVTPRPPTADHAPHLPALADEAGDRQWHPVSVTDVEPPERRAP
jgi:nucleotide-binding universal stress UspA family protein